MRQAQLSPKEKRRFDKCVSNAEFLASRPFLCDTDVFILRQQVKVILQMLGSSYVDKVLLREALDIFERRDKNTVDKVSRLIELIDGRRR